MASLSDSDDDMWSVASSEKSVDEEEGEDEEVVEDLGGLGTRHLSVSRDDDFFPGKSFEVKKESVGLDLCDSAVEEMLELLARVRKRVGLGEDEILTDSLVATAVWFQDQSDSSFILEHLIRHMNSYIQHLTERHGPRKLDWPQRVKCLYKMKVDRDLLSDWINTYLMICATQKSPKDFFRAERDPVTLGQSSAHALSKGTMKEDDAAIIRALLIRRSTSP